MYGFHVIQMAPMTMKVPARKKTFCGINLREQDAIGEGNNKRYLIHGNGCRIHGNCFTCPYPEHWCRGKK